MIPFGLKATDELVGDIERMQFAVDLLFAHAAGDQLGDLGTEIEDQDFLVGHGGIYRFGSMSGKRRENPAPVRSRICGRPSSRHKEGVVRRQ
jgi:hypothetical protein